MHMCLNMPIVTRFRGTARFNAIISTGFNTHTKKKKNHIGFKMN